LYVIPEISVDDRITTCMVTPTENINKPSIPYKIKVNIKSFLMAFHCRSKTPYSLNSENIIDNEEYGRWEDW
jgi:hypothetical protein